MRIKEKTDHFPNDTAFLRLNQEFKTPDLPAEDN